MILQGDCLKMLPCDRSFNLIVADPPYNQGVAYDGFADKNPSYGLWCEQWVTKCYLSLKSNGTMWIVIPDEWAAEVAIMAKRVGFVLRNWVIWYYSFGQNTREKFARTKCHLLYFVRGREYTFNPEYIESERQRIGDKRAAPEGKVRDDVWFDIPRLCGTFLERVGWHPCQLPEALVERIVSHCSNAGDHICDPFAGSGTTGVVCKKLGRLFTGYEVSPRYTELGNARIERGG